MQKRKRKSKKIKKVMTASVQHTDDINLSFLEESDGWKQVYHHEVFNVMKAVGIDITNDDYGLYFWQFKNVAIAGVRKPTEACNNYEFFIIDKSTNKLLETKTGTRSWVEKNIKYDPNNIITGKHIQQYVEDKY